MKNFRFKILLLIINVLLIGAGCIPQKNNTDQNSATSTSNNSNTLNASSSYDMNEVIKHNTQNDCWLIIDNNIYDVTNYIPYHPAGPEAIIRNCGKDATTIFNMKHKPDKKQLLNKFLLGTIKSL